MCRMMVASLVLSLCGCSAASPNQGEPQSSKLEGRAKAEWAIGDPLLSRNWSFRLKAVELDPEKGVKRVSAVLCNLSRETVRVDECQIHRRLREGLRLWPRQASGVYGMRLNPCVRINWAREMITLHSGQEVTISWQMPANFDDTLPDFYQLVYSSRDNAGAAECSPAHLNPGLYVVEGMIELSVYEAKKDGTGGKRLGPVLVHTDNKLWVDLRESEQANRGE